MDDTYYMKQALAEARKAMEQGEVPVGAVVVCRDRIIARAYNLTETLTDVTAHAEMQAITAAASALGGKYLSNCTLYVTVTGLSTLRPASPAPQDGGRARSPERGLCRPDEGLLQAQAVTLSGI